MALTSAVDINLDAITLPHQAGDTDSEDDDCKIESFKNINQTPVENWDWDALFIPFYGRSTRTLPNTPKSKLQFKTTLTSNNKQISSKPTPLKHTTKLYRGNEEIPPWMSSQHRDTDSCFLDCLHLELLDFCCYVSPTKEEHSNRLVLIAKIKDLMKQIWPNSSCHVFGSMKTGLYLPTSDIDIVVYPHISHLEMDRDPKAELANALKANKMVSYLEIIKTAKVPLVKFTDIDFGVSVDIVFERQTGIIAADEINSLQQEYPMMRPLTYFLKYFLWFRDLNEPFRGGMGSYLLQMLITNLIQTHPIRATKRWRKVDDEISLGGWLMAFFELYGKTFNYSNLGIVPLPKAHYFVKEDRRMKNYHQPYLLCMQCPFETTHAKLADAGKNTYNIMKIRASFDWAYDTLLRNSRSHKPGNSILSLLVGLRGPMLALRSNENQYKVIANEPDEIDKLLYKTFNNDNTASDDDDDDSDESTDDLEHANDDVYDDDDSVEDNDLDDDELFIPFKKEPSSSVTVSECSNNSGGSLSSSIYDSEDPYFEASEFQSQHLFHRNDKVNQPQQLSYDNVNNTKRNTMINPFLNDETPKFALKRSRSSKLLSDYIPPKKKRKRINNNVAHQSTPCLFYKKGNCNKGKLCSFSHDIAIDKTKTPRCFHFISGNCSRGESCRYLH